MKSFKQFNENVNPEMAGFISGAGKNAGTCNRCGEHKDPVLKVDYHKSGKTCFDCYKKDSPDAIIHYDKNGSADRFEGSTASSISSKECHICGKEFKKGEKPVKFAGEYNVHKECK